MGENYLKFPYRAEYAKSGTSGCRGCGNKIAKESLRLGVRTPARTFDNTIFWWYHFHCFFHQHCPETPDDIDHLEDLRWDDQEKIKEQISVNQETEPDIKKRKLEYAADEAIIKKQNIIMYKYRDELKSNLKKQELTNLLKYNRQKVPVGIETILDCLSDAMTFGALQPCEKCNNCRFAFKKTGYLCEGYTSKWETSCNHFIKVPKRKPFEVPYNLAEKYSFLRKYKYIPTNRFIREVHPTHSSKVEDEDCPDGERFRPNVERQNLPLYNMEIVIVGHKDEEDSLTKKVTSMGGKVVSTIQKSVMAVVATIDDVEKMEAPIADAQKEDIQVVSKDFVDEAEHYVGKIPELVLIKSICNWGSNPILRLPPKASKFPNLEKMRTKGVVDPDSGLQGCAHVYKEGNEIYDVQLIKTNIQKNQNSYYNMQLLVANNKNRFWVFTSWGRIGTDIRDRKLDEKYTLEEAKQQFTYLFFQKTGNDWKNTHNFRKIPGKYFEKVLEYDEEAATSKLTEPIQELMRLIFNKNNFEKVLLGFGFGAENKPLKRCISISNSQIQQALGVLSDLRESIMNNEPRSKLTEASNKFYMYIPHSFGDTAPPVIDNEKMVNEKLEMVSTIYELKAAYDDMKAVGPTNDIDTCYSRLNTDISVLHRESREFKLIEEYVVNTHATAHDHYVLEILEVFTVKRRGEEERFRNLHNKKLLWHGSRLINFAGILSKGLRIAPEGVQRTGDMFGNGIYFADMVSKSANYCDASRDSPTGLLLLCVVALGNMYECIKETKSDKLPENKHSTKGIGSTQPDPEATKLLLEDIEVPLGKAREDPQVKSSLLHNEYIVYNEDQVRIRYLVKVNFRYK